MNFKHTNINSFWGYLIIEELIRNGVDYFCISPGSRSTPLTVAVADNSKAKSIVGGGETLEVVSRLGLQSQISFVSTGGGAMLKYLEGKRLLSLEVLNNEKYVKN